MRVNSELSSEEWVKVTRTTNTKGPAPMVIEGGRLRWVSYSQVVFSCRRHLQPRDPSHCDRGHLKECRGPGLQQPETRPQRSILLEIMEPEAPPVPHRRDKQTDTLF